MPNELRAVAWFALLTLAPPCAGAADRGVGLDLAALSDSLRQVVDRVGPAVVEISTTGFSATTARGTAVLSRQRGTGSGIIVTPDGYVVTNRHVVEGARRVQVLLPRRDAGEGGSILRPTGDVLEAEIVGTDRETDLAVLRIEGEDLPSVAFGDSESLRQGDLVLAFGSPLGLEQSVTMGIVSAVARQLEPESPMIYIQTDAPINPGNSGGPLVDARGRLVGINTLIASQSGGNEGIGFAAPSNIVVAVFEQIRETGRVRRGEIGVRSQTVTPVLARALGLPREHGVVVRDVVPGSPAAEVGIEVGDLVLSLDGRPMDNARQLDVGLYRRKVGSGVPLDLLRGERTLHVVPLVAERPGDPAGVAQLLSPGQNLVPRLGILALDLDSRVLALLPRLRARAGAVVAAGSAGAPFEGEALQPGDVIYAVNGESVTGVGPLRDRLRGLARSRPLVLQIEREGELRWVVVEPDWPGPAEAPAEREEP